jgi:hypothetical protein
MPVSSSFSSGNSSSLSFEGVREIVLFSGEARDDFRRGLAVDERRSPRGLTFGLLLLVTRDECAEVNWKDIFRQ